jgi:hypothetical protein
LARADQVVQPEILSLIERFDVPAPEADAMRAWVTARPAPASAPSTQLSDAEIDELARLVLHLASNPDP